MRGMLDNLRLKVMPPIPEAIRDQFTILRARRVETQTNVMYMMLLATTPTAAWAGAANLHWAIKFGMPALLAVLCVLGLIENAISRRRPLGLRRAQLIVKKTASVTGWVGVMCSSWAVLNWFASPPEAHAAFAMIIAIAASSAFMTPVSSPVNTLVVGPGNYGFGDFVKIGVPFTIIVMAASLILVPWLLPL